MTDEFMEWFDKNAIWMPDSSAMMFDVWNSILKFTSNNRTCENCVHYQMNDGNCLNDEQDYDFGCNQFIKKEN